MHEPVLPIAKLRIVGVMGDGRKDIPELTERAENE